MKRQGWLSGELLFRTFEFEILAEIAQVAHAAFSHGTPYMILRDELGALFSDADFASLFSPQGRALESPAILAIVTAVVVKW